MVSKSPGLFMRRKPAARTFVTGAVQEMVERQKWEGSRASSDQPHRSIVIARNRRAAAALDRPQPNDERGEKREKNRKSKVTADM